MQRELVEREAAERQDGQSYATDFAITPRNGGENTSWSELKASCSMARPMWARAWAMSRV